MKPLMNLAHDRHIAVIEDCAQAHGATDHGLPVGGIGHVGCFSFCQDKIISTGGEGGMVVTDDELAYRRMWAFRDHGKDFVRATSPETAPGFQFLVDQFGTNWRMTEMQAAIGRLQLQKLPRWVARRRHIATVLAQTLANLEAVGSGPAGTCPPQLLQIRFPDRSRDAERGLGSGSHNRNA